jgi:single-stranded DNA-binding protein
MYKSVSNAEREEIFMTRSLQERTNVLNITGKVVSEPKVNNGFFSFSLLHDDGYFDRETDEYKSHPNFWTCMVNVNKNDRRQKRLVENLKKGDLVNVNGSIRTFRDRDNPEKQGNTYISVSSLFSYDPQYNTGNHSDSGSGDSVPDNINLDGIDIPDTII